MALNIVSAGWERRALQMVLATIAIVPVLAGSAGALLGPDMVHVLNANPSAESHFRYLSGLLFAIGIAYWSCVPGIELHGQRLKLLTGIVFVGGLARALDLYFDGVPTPAHVGALGIELVIAPAVMIWQHRVAALSTATARTAPHGLQKLASPKL